MATTLLWVGSVKTQVLALVRPERVLPGFGTQLDVWQHGTFSKVENPLPPALRNSG